MGALHTIDLVVLGTYLIIITAVGLVLSRREIGGFRTQRTSDRWDWTFLASCIDAATSTLTNLVYRLVYAIAFNR